MNKKRRVREAFLVTKKWKGVSSQETYWDFTITDLEQSLNKMVKRYDYFYNNIKSPYYKNEDYNPNNITDIVVNPYPKSYNVELDEMKKDNTTIVRIDAQDESEVEELIKTQYPKAKILSINQGIQIIT